MEVLLLAIYAFFVWLIFFKFKWLAWTMTAAVVVVTIPIIGTGGAGPAAERLRAVGARRPGGEVRRAGDPSRHRPRDRGAGRAEPPRPQGRRAVSHRSAAVPVQVDRLEALLASTTAGVGAQREELRAADAQIEVSLNRVTSVESSIEANRVRMKLAELRVGQTDELADAGAGDRFEAERWQTDLEQQRADLGALLPQLSAAEQEVTASRRTAAGLREKLGARSGDEQADVAQVGAQLADARWKLNETVVYAPADGWVINLQLRPGSTVSQLPLNPVMSFVEQEQIILALFGQNELHEVEPGNEAEIALATYPGRIIKARVDSIIWAQGQGQLPLTGTLPQTGADTAAGGAIRRQARACRPRQRLVPRGRGAGDRRHLYQAPPHDSHHPQGAPARVRVSGLDHHQAPHQPALIPMGSLWPKRRSGGRRGGAGVRVRGEAAATAGSDAGGNTACRRRPSPPPGQHLPARRARR